MEVLIVDDKLVYPATLHPAGQRTVHNGQDRPRRVLARRLVWLNRGSHRCLKSDFRFHGINCYPEFIARRGCGAMRW